VTSKAADAIQMSSKIKALLEREPGLSVKEIADRMEVNRQFMAGFLAALEEREGVSFRKVGPARIYYKSSNRR